MTASLVLTIGSFVVASALWLFVVFYERRANERQGLSDIQAQLFKALRVTVPLVVLIGLIGIFVVAAKSG